MYPKLLTVVALVFTQTVVANVGAPDTNPINPRAIDVVDRNRMLGMTLGAHPHMVPLTACQVTSVTKHYKDGKLHNVEERHVTFGATGRVEKLRRDKKEYTINYDAKDVLISGAANYRVIKRNNILYWHHTEGTRALDSYTYRSYITGEDHRKHVTETYDKEQDKNAEHWSTILPTGVFFGYGVKNESDVRWQWKQPNKVARYRLDSKLMEVHLARPDARGNPTRSEAWFMGSVPKRLNTIDYTYKYCD